MVFGIEVTERFRVDHVDCRRWQSQGGAGLAAGQYFPRCRDGEGRACGEGLVFRGCAVAVVLLAVEQAAGGEGGRENIVPVFAFQRDGTAPEVTFAVSLVNPGTDGQILGGHVFGGPRGVGGGAARFDGKAAFVPVADAGGEVKFPGVFVIERVGVGFDAVGEELVVGLRGFGRFCCDFGGESAF